MEDNCLGEIEEDKEKEERKRERYIYKRNR